MPTVTAPWRSRALRKLLGIFGSAEQLELLETVQPVAVLGRAVGSIETRLAEGSPGAAQSFTVPEGQAWRIITATCRQHSGGGAGFRAATNIIAKISSGGGFQLAVVAAASANATDAQGVACAVWSPHETWLRSGDQLSLSETGGSSEDFDASLVFERVDI